ncbi:MAG: MerR family transcriptional regulator, partial [Nitrospinota bacterium]|nr:MerR family transcriptional regulator [Nitrospinota bacterium]
MKQPIPDKLFFKIGEVAEIAEVEQHVLRYWEEEFDVLKPNKNRSGQRL